MPMTIDHDDADRMREPTDQEEGSGFVQYTERVQRTRSICALSS
jgi:hypothetical protein